MSNEQSNQIVTWVKVIFNCVDCGNDIECYGPFDTEKLAEEFEPESNIAGMTCLRTRVIPLTTKRRIRNE